MLYAGMAWIVPARTDRVLACACPGLAPDAAAVDIPGLTVGLPAGGAAYPPVAPQ